MLLFATDYPHWQFDGDQAIPPLVSAGLRHKMMVENPLRTYARLRETVP
jgi:predicted TIM-barrel fold metal-dependent hydrolase